MFWGDDDMEHMNDSPGVQPFVRRVRFGETDLYVSRLCQGTAFRHLPRNDNPGSLRVLKHCLEVGVNFFDSSNAYGWGGAEGLLGQAIAGWRDRVVICTKVAAYQAVETNGLEGAATEVSFSREFLFAQVESSLDRLGTDYIDLYMLHQSDKITPAEEIVDTMEALVTSGKIRYWGISNHTAAQVNEYLNLCGQSEKPSIAGVEEYYTIAGKSLNEEGASRTALLEQELFPIIRDTGIGLLAFGPMDGGHLAVEHPEIVSSPLKALIVALDEVALDLAVPRAAVCVAWVLTHGEVTSVLAGSESPEHVEANLIGTTLELADSVLMTLNTASHNYRTAQNEDQS